MISHMTFDFFNVTFAFWSQLFHFRSRILIIFRICLIRIRKKEIKSGSNTLGMWVSYSCFQNVLSRIFLAICTGQPFLWAYGRERSFQSCSVAIETTANRLHVQSGAYDRGGGVPKMVPVRSSQKKFGTFAIFSKRVLQKMTELLRG